MQYSNSVKKVGFLLPLCVLGGLLYSGCSAPAGDESMVRTPAIKSHIVQSEDLRYLMHSMNNMIQVEPEKSELEYDDARRRYALRLADTIEEIATALERFPEKSDALKTPQDQARFKAYAADLFRHGEQIQALATAYEMEKLEPALNDMIRTCNACHRHFNAHATRIERGM